MFTIQYKVIIKVFSVQKMFNFLIKKENIFKVFLYFAKLYKVFN